jgi:hypothetical protein
LGRFTLSWEVEEGTYFGTLVMRGEQGRFRVRTPDKVIIDQDMTAEYHADGLWLVGSNVMWAPHSEQPDSYYYNPDQFHLTELQKDLWTIDDTCDGERCATVQVVEASTF